MTVVDVTDADFQTAVIDRSAELPVVVDFWAEWCAPCRQLGPVLEKEAAAREGEVVLAKIDTDSNQTVARAFEIQGIPAVKAFKDGAVVSEFTGAVPPAQVKAFFDTLVPSEADRLAAAGDEASLRRALELEPNRIDAALALGRIEQERGNREAAVELLEGLPGFAAEGLLARLRLEAADPALAGFFDKADAGDHETALDGLLTAIAAAEEGEHRDDLRRAIVGILDQLGVEHPLARDARRRLAAALY